MDHLFLGFLPFSFSPSSRTCSNSRVLEIRTFSDLLYDGIPEVPAVQWPARAFFPRTSGQPLFSARLLLAKSLSHQGLFTTVKDLLPLGQKFLQSPFLPPFFFSMYVAANL